MRLFMLCYSNISWHCVSIHAPARGATRTALDSFLQSRYKFQSTHPRGVRRAKPWQEMNGILFQSTHPRGVRLTAQHNNFMSVGFQSTHPRGVRLTREIKEQVEEVFQSTHPRGVRRGLYAENSDALNVSIHAPARGATAWGYMGMY